MEEPLVRAVDAVRGFVAGREPLNDTLNQISVFAVRSLAVDMAGLSLLYPDGRTRTAVCTSSTASKVDQAQYDADRGPCLEAFRSKTMIRVDDTRTDERWPEFAEAAEAHGVLSSLSAPLIVAGEGTGALNLYSGSDRHFSEHDEGDAEMFAGQAAIALANAQAYWEQADLAANLDAAMRSRATIEQAKGVIMATAHIGPDEAFDVLRQQSQAENRKLREIAEEIVGRQGRARK